MRYRRIRRTGFLRADIHGRIDMQKVLIAAVIAAVGFSSAALAEGKKPAAVLEEMLKKLG